MAVPKIYTMGPMFRYERPQKGRYRQFHQLDVEVFGVKDPSIDAEVIDLAWASFGRWASRASSWRSTSVGCPACRPAFTAALVAALGEDVRQAVRRLPAAGGDEPAAHLRLQGPGGPAGHRRPAAQRGLPVRGVPCPLHQRQGLAGRLRHPVPVSHRLVRGLDYYTRTTFEILAGQLGAQNAVLGGGRYDGLVKQLGGPDRVGIGFAAGIERLVLALPESPGARRLGRTCSWLRWASRRAQSAFELLRDLRRAGLNAQVEYRGPVAEVADEAGGSAQGAPGDRAR